MSHNKKRQLVGPKAPPWDSQPFRRLPSFRLFLLAHHSDRLHERYYKKHFGLDLWEGRTIAVVGGYGMASLRHTRESLHLGRARVGLLVRRLIQRELLTKVIDEADKRIIKLVLTTRGRAIHKALHASAVSLNEGWLSSIPKEHQEAFTSDLDILISSARNLRRSQD